MVAEGVTTNWQGNLAGHERGAVIDKSYLGIQMTIKIYGIFNTLNEWVYIGSTKYSLRKRWREHMCLLRGGKHSSSEMQKEFEACGKDTEVFVIKCLEELPDGAMVLDKRVAELFWMQHHAGHLYNAYEIAYEPETAGRLRGTAASAKNAPARNAKLFADPVKKAQMISGLVSPENRKSRSERMKELWKDPSFKAARLKDLEAGRGRHD